MSFIHVIPWDFVDSLDISGSMTAQNIRSPVVMCCNNIVYQLVVIKDSEIEFDAITLIYIPKGFH